MTRRSFISRLTAIAGGLTLDPERALWTPKRYVAGVDWDVSTVLLPPGYEEMLTYQIALDMATARERYRAAVSSFVQVQSERHADLDWMRIVKDAQIITGLGS